MRSKTTKNLLSVFGVISLVIAVTTAIPSFINNSYIGLGISMIFVILGAVFLSIAYGD